jgi:hypothetical protein
MYCFRPHARKSRCLHRRWAVPGLLLLPLGLALGCGDDAVAPYHEPATTEAAKLYWELTLDRHAVTLSTAAPYDTIRLTATPRDADGRLLTVPGTVTFRSTDESRVAVDADGVVRALKAGTNISVIAELTAANVRHADTATIMVTTVAAPPVLSSISIQPIPPDSAHWAASGSLASMKADAIPLSVVGYVLPVLLGKPIAVRATDTDGRAISGLTVHITSSDVTVAAVSAHGLSGSGGAMLIPYRPGRTVLVASATVYGVTRTDTLPFTITMPTFGFVSIQTPVTSGGASSVVASPHEITIRPGGVVFWFNESGQPVDLLFDDPTQVVEAAVSCGPGDPGGAGDISAFGDGTSDLTHPANCRIRRFPVAGVYPYHSATPGITGRIVVTDDGLSNP